MPRRKQNAARYPNGRLKRPTLKQIEDMERQRLQEQLAVVLAQPHRKGDTSQLCENALGRFCLANKIEGFIFNACEEWANVVRRWRAAKGIPTNIRLSSPGISDGPAEATVRAWEGQIARVNRELASVTTPIVYVAARRLVLEGVDQPDINTREMADALLGITVGMGAAKPSQSPFRR